MTTKPRRKAKKAAPKGPKKPKGRPTIFTKALAAEICKRLALTGNLRAVCRADDMPTEAIVRCWALDDRDGFFAQYTRARELGYLSMADELTEIADDDSGDVKIDGEGNERHDSEFSARSRLRLDTRKWLLSKALPKIYGDKLAVTGDGGGAIKTETEITVIELVAQPIPTEMLDEPAPDADDE